MKVGFGRAFHRAWRKRQTVNQQGKQQKGRYEVSYSVSHTIYSKRLPFCLKLGGVVGADYYEVGIS